MTGTAETAVSGAGHKIVALDEFADIRRQIRDAGETLVHCHGIFDVLTPGHVRHLEEAVRQGDRLVVTVPSDRPASETPLQPHFDQGQRMAAVAALGCVSYVVPCDDPGEASRVLTPDVRVPSRLLSEHFEELPPSAAEYARDLSARHSFDDVRAMVDSLESLRVLVVGEVIVDEYIRCEMQGVTPKDHIPSARWLASERMWGGSFAVARHLASFCGRVTLAGIAGEGEEVAAEQAPAGTPESIVRSFEVDAGARTVVKQRFVIEDPKRTELDKVFSVKFVADPWEVSDDARRRFRTRLDALLQEHDLVVVTDYGHGMIDPETQALIEERSPFLALNCQTNSSNFGFNPITKWHRADTFGLDQNELALAFRDRSRNWEPLLERLREMLATRVGWLTLGSAGSLASTADGELVRTPALTLHAVDTIGAGDAFFALASASARAGLPVEVGSFLGNVAGAIAVNIVGNEKSVGRDQLLRFAAAVLDA